MDGRVEEWKGGRTVVYFARIAEDAEGVSWAFQVDFHKLALILAKPHKRQISTEKGNEG